MNLIQEGFGADVQPQICQEVTDDASGPMLIHMC